MTEGIRQLINKNNILFFFFAVCAFVQFVSTEKSAIIVIYFSQSK